MDEGGCSRAHVRPSWEDVRSGNRATNRGQTGLDSLSPAMDFSGDPYYAVRECVAARAGKYMHGMTHFRSEIQGQLTRALRRFGKWQHLLQATDTAESLEFMAEHDGEW